MNRVVHPSEKDIIIDGYQLTKKHNTVWLSKSKNKFHETTYVPPALNALHQNKLGPIPAPILLLYHILTRSFLRSS